MKFNIEDIIHIKDAFPSLPTKKITEVSDILNKSELIKPYMKITTKKPSRKQVIMFISRNNANAIICNTSTFIFNTNKSLQELNSNTFANYIQLEEDRVIITTNQAASPQDTNIIEKCIKDSKEIDLEHIDKLQLP